MLIIGAQGFASELTDTVLETIIASDLYFYDDITAGAVNLKFGRFRIIRSVDEATAYFKKNGIRFTLGVGNPHLRKKLAEKFITLGGSLTTIISRRAAVGLFNNRLAQGCIVMPQAIIEADNTIGQGTLIHVSAFISHNVTIGSYCEIAPYAKLLGNTAAGNLTSIGAGAVILPGVKVGNNCTVGAGAVVTKDVTDNLVVAGVPAVVIRNNKPL